MGCCERLKHLPFRSQGIAFLTSSVDIWAVALAIPEVKTRDTSLARQLVARCFYHRVLGPQHHTTQPLIQCTCLYIYYKYVVKHKPFLINVRRLLSPLTS